MSETGFWTGWHAINDEEGVLQAWINTGNCPPNYGHPERKGVFCVVTVDPEIHKRVTDPETFKNYLDVQRIGAQIELRERGCTHNLPPLPPPPEGVPVE